MLCCFGIKRDDKEPPYSKIDHEDSKLLDGDYISGSKYSSVDQFLNHHKTIHGDAINLWTNPDDVTHCIEKDDHILMTFIQDCQNCTSSQKKEEIEKSINKIRNNRRGTHTRWKGILIDLGFDQDAERLLNVTSIAESEDPSILRSSRALDLHLRLVEESHIFGQSSPQAVRYIVVLDRLLDLDIADSFLLAAIKKYPKALQS